VVSSLLWFPLAGRGGVGRTRWQLQLLFFFGIFDVVFGIASIGSSSLAIAPPSRRTLSPTFSTFCSESNQVMRPRRPWRRLSAEILADLEWEEDEGVDCFCKISLGSSVQNPDPCLYFFILGLSVTSAAV
jgi:hypothetical protein